MKLNHFAVRCWIMVILTLAIFGVFLGQLMNIQIVRADEIRQRLESQTVSKQVVKAIRGEIVDRNGVAMVSNQLGYDVVIEWAFFPKAQRNDIILELIRLFEKNGETWTDNLPISTTKPYTFLPEYDVEANRLKEHLEIQVYSTADQALYWMSQRYGLEDYTDADARKIAGVRYEMERRGFNVRTPYTFATDISIQLVLQIKERNYALTGVDIQESAIRVFNMGTIAPHLIGRVGPIYKEEYEKQKERLEAEGYLLDDVMGISGVEAAFEKFLRGKNGTRIITQDASNQVVGAQDSDPPVPGNTIQLTLDSDLQDVAQRALETQIRNLQQTAPAGKGKEANVGAVAALNPKTGQILALASYPSYDLNTYPKEYSNLLADTELKPLIDRALTGQYAPGSTFKPVVATAGLASGVVTEQSNVYCGLVYTRFPDYQPRCLRHDGNIDVVRALSLSCNIYFYDVGYNTGIDLVNETARQYGLGEPTGIEVREAVGQRATPETLLASNGETWGGGSVLQASIGQLVQRYTPLQLANYTATIANRGTRMKATIVREIQDYSRQQAVQPFEAVVADRVNASPEVFETVIKGMVAASRTGTAMAHFGSYPVDVASKTGTPESAYLPNSTFICFAPAEDPDIAIAVVIEQGWHGYTGAPVAKAIMDEYFGYQSPNPLLPREPQVSDADRVSAASGIEAQAPGGEESSSSEEESSQS